MALGFLFLATGCLQGALNKTSQTAPRALTAKEIEARLSQPVFKTIQHEEATIEGSNGTKLWVDVFRPQDNSEKVPVILVATPYRFFADAENTQCTNAQRDQCPYDQELTNYFLPRGYAIAFMDVRGNHNSGGCMDFLSPESWRDGYNTVEWLASRPWSSGKVGMYGGSYDGGMEIGTAILDPPHLATIVPGSSVTSYYASLYYDGVPYFLAPLSTTLQYLTLSAAPGQDPNSFTTYPERFECQPQNLGTALDQSGDWNAYWEARELRASVSRIRASVLDVQGLVDETIRPDQLDDFWNNLTSEKRLILGHWDHQPPTRPDWLLIRHRWFDQYLKGIDTGLLQDLPPVLIQDSAGAWRGIDSFPPPVAQTITFYASADGTLSLLPAASGNLTLRDYPRESFEQPQLVAVGETVTGQPRRLVFTSQPLQEDLHITGRPMVFLLASTNAKNTHWAARIIDADAPAAQGRDADGADGSTILNRGFTDARHRFGITHPQDLVPGGSYSESIRLYPHDDVIPKGHRIRLTLNNDDNKIQQDTTFATSIVQLGGPDGTRLVLPIGLVGVPVPADALRPDLEGAS